MGNIREIWVMKNGTFIVIHIFKEIQEKYADVSAFVSSSVSCYVLSGFDTVIFPFNRGKIMAVKYFSH